MAAATTHRRLLLTASVGTFVWVFFAFLLWEQPGLGIGHFYYVAIALAALATGPRWGALAGTAATGLYATGVGGIRLEDDVAVTDGEPDLLSSLPLEFREVPA